jgi:hypothetical protein
MKRLVIFLVTLIVGFAGFYMYNKFDANAAGSGESSLEKLHIEEITPDMDLDTRLKFWSEHFASDMASELMKNLSVGQSGDLSFRVRSVNFNEQLQLYEVEVYASWLDKINSESNFYEVVIKTDFNLKNKTVTSSTLNGNELFNSLKFDKDFNLLIEQSSVRSLQYLQEII